MVHLTNFRLSKTEPHVVVGHTSPGGLLVKSHIQLQVESRQYSEDSSLRRDDSRAEKVHSGGS